MDSKIYKTKIYKSLENIKGFAMEKHQIVHNENPGFSDIDDNEKGVLKCFQCFGCFGSAFTIGEIKYNRKRNQINKDSSKNIVISKEVAPIEEGPQNYASQTRNNKDLVANELKQLKYKLMDLLDLSTEDLSDIDNIGSSMTYYLDTLVSEIFALKYVVKSTYGDKCDMSNVVVIVDEDIRDLFRIQLKGPLTINLEEDLFRIQLKGPLTINSEEEIDKEINLEEVGKTSILALMNKQYNDIRCTNSTWRKKEKELGPIFVRPIFESDQGETKLKVLYLSKTFECPNNYISPHHSPVLIGSTDWVEALKSTVTVMNQCQRRFKMNEWSFHLGMNESEA